MGFYASLVNVNAYHQPGVEAGKKAAGAFLKSLSAVKAALAQSGRSVAADEVAAASGVDAEEAWFCLTHLAANDPHASVRTSANPAADRFLWKAKA